MRRNEREGIVMHQVRVRRIAIAVAVMTATATGLTVGGSAAVAAGAKVASTAALPPGCSAWNSDQAVCTFSTPGAFSFTPPLGATDVLIDAFGAQGGNGLHGDGTGGLGAVASGDFSSTIDGQTLTFTVGAQGATTASGNPGAGGSPNGGSGGAVDANFIKLGGNGGGGASSVASSNVLLVGAGGGRRGCDGTRARRLGCERRGGRHHRVHRELGDGRSRRSGRPSDGRWRRGRRRHDQPGELPGGRERSGREHRRCAVGRRSRRERWRHASRRGRRTRRRWRRRLHRRGRRGPGRELRHIRVRGDRRRRRWRGRQQLLRSIDPQRRDPRRRQRGRVRQRQDHRAAHRQPGAVRDQHHGDRVEHHGPLRAHLQRARERRHVFERSHVRERQRHPGRNDDRLHRSTEWRRAVPALRGDAQEAARARKQHHDRIRHGREHDPRRGREPDAGTQLSRIPLRHECRCRRRRTRVHVGKSRRTRPRSAVRCSVLGGAERRCNTSSAVRRSPGTR